MPPCHTCDAPDSIRSDTLPLRCAIVARLLQTRLTSPPDAEPESPLPTRCTRDIPPLTPCAHNVEQAIHHLGFDLSPTATRNFLAVLVYVPKAFSLEPKGGSHSDGHLGSLASGSHRIIAPLSTYRPMPNLTTAEVAACWACSLGKVRAMIKKENCVACG